MGKMAGSNSRRSFDLLYLLVTYGDLINYTLVTLTTVIENMPGELCWPTSRGQRLLPEDTPAIIQSLGKRVDFSPTDKELCWTRVF